MRCFDCTVRPSLAEKSGFLPTISHNMKFSKDIVLKSDGRISKKMMLFPNHIFLFKKSPQTLPCCPFRDLFAALLCLHVTLTYTDAPSDLGHTKFHMRLKALRAMTLF